MNACAAGQSPIQVNEKTRIASQGLEPKCVAHSTHIAGNATQYKKGACAYRKSHSAVFPNVALLHCAQNLPQYQFVRDRFPLNTGRNLSGIATSRALRNSMH